MLRTVKPKNARSKRAQDERAPKLLENPKKTIILRGTSASEMIQNVLSDLNSLKKPHTLKFMKKNVVHPFEDVSTFEFFSEKNDTSLLAFGSHSKKRPHNLTLARTFDHRVLDMYEFGVDTATFRSLDSFRNEKCGVGMKPMVVFTGGFWEREKRGRELRSLWLDFFRGETVKSVDVGGLRYMIQLAAPETMEGGEGGKPVRVHLRCYLIRTRRSGSKMPRVEVEEMGPRIDLTLRRVQEAPDDIMSEALKKPKALEPKNKKNVDMDIMGDKIGRIHTGKQDFSKMQSRKMKGLKKRGHEDDDDGATLVDADEAEETDSSFKRLRTE